MKQRYKMQVTCEMEYEIEKKYGLYQIWRVAKDGSLSRYGWGTSRAHALASGLAMYKDSFRGRKIVSTSVGPMFKRCSCGMIKKKGTKCKTA